MQPTEATLERQPTGDAYDNDDGTDADAAPAVRAAVAGATAASGAAEREHCLHVEEWARDDGGDLGGPSAGGVYHHQSDHDDGDNGGLALRDGSAAAAADYDAGSEGAGLGSGDDRGHG